MAFIRKVTWIGFWVNALLTVLKLLFGFIGHSDALVADGIHSLSDFATDFVVIIFIGLAYRSADADHPYGHGKFETFSTLLIGVALIAVAFGIGLAGVKSVWLILSGMTLPSPERSALVVAAISILLKEALYQYTIRAAKRVNSSSLRANAWHHRSDSFSSIATLIGVAAAIFLGDKWRVLDPVASVVIALFIAHSALCICTPAVNELLERSLPDSMVSEIEALITGTDGVRLMHHLRTRRNGRFIIIDCHVKVDPLITVIEGHDIATAVERRLKAKFGDNTITNIHVEPAKQEC